MQYTISNEKLSVSVDDYGAQLVSVRYNGKERRQQHERCCRAAIKRALHSLNDKRDAEAEDKDRKDWPEATHDPGAGAEDCPQDDDPGSRYHDPKTSGAFDFSVWRTCRGGVLCGLPAYRQNILC